MTAETGRHAEPAFEGPMKGRRLGVAEQVADLGDGERRFGEEPFRGFAARLCEDVLERRRPRASRRWRVRGLIASTHARASTDCDSVSPRARCTASACRSMSATLLAGAPLRGGMVGVEVSDAEHFEGRPGLRGRCARRRRRGGRRPVCRGRDRNAARAPGRPGPSGDRGLLSRALCQLSIHRVHVDERAGARVGRGRLRRRGLPGEPHARRRYAGS